MKKYVKPTMNGEMFVSNEYVSACWIISCNAPSGTLWRETNGLDGLQTSYTLVGGKYIGKDQNIGSFGPNPSKIHRVNDNGYDGGIFSGYIVNKSGTIPVTGWYNGSFWDYDYHATSDSKEKWQRDTDNFS